jgi:exonuclease SbcC
MIIRSIRLKNIKSYGVGTTGEGITVPFDTGINRIAGRNGHGKSTLIESLGYALFLTPPVFEENFNAATYLLRAGTNAGEIDVTFEHDGESYRVERGLGTRSQRRSKVVLLGDGSIAAEGDPEVSAFLCRLLGCPAPDCLSELFAKLIGVKQGRLAWPFDSKPAEARKHFEPLLDVEIFRQCFDRLKPVLDVFTTAAQTENTKLATIDERLRDRQDAPERARARRAEIEQLEAGSAAARSALKQAEETKLGWEALERTSIDLRELAGKAKHEAGLATERRMHADQRMKESVEAASVVARTAAAHASFIEAERSLDILQVQQRECAQLKAECSKCDARRIEASGKAAAAKAFSEDCAKRRDVCEKRAADLKSEAVSRRSSLAKSKPQFDQDAAAVQQARKDEEAMRHWVSGLEEKLAGFEKSSAAIGQMVQAVRAWKPDSLTEARGREQISSKQLEEISGQLTAATEIHGALTRQLEEIAGGVCPFLKESCRQFDPAKVSVDVRAREADIAQLKKQVAVVRENQRVAKADAERLHASESKIATTRDALAARLADLDHECEHISPAAIAEASKRLGSFADEDPFACAALAGPASQDDLTGWLKQMQAYNTSAQSWFQGLAPALRERFESFDKARDRRVREEHEISVIEKQRDDAQKETEALATTFAAKQKEAAKFGAKAEAEAQAITALMERLKAFLALDAQMSEQQQRKGVHADGYQRHIAAKPAAESLPERQRLADELKAAETRAAQTLEECLAKSRAAAEAVDLNALEGSRKAFQERSKESAVAETKLAHARTELIRDENRLREYEQATARKAEINLELGRIKAAIALTDKARNILKNAAPLVAQHLCHLIAVRAQQIFNHINHEPAELEWSSQQYSLRIQPGDRRFAMLSGGEQTKLALAMTLAMIQEFSGLKFCVFDEPTYGVDGDSRLKLADAILAAQEAAVFDQLLLVSHDDAFDGKIEHTVRLNKTAAGTQPVVE